MIDIKEILSGKYDGKMVYICDYRFNDVNNKPIRFIFPQKVLVVSAKDVDKRIYYSSSCFLALNKKGEPTSKIIPVVDNTGFRSISGVPCKTFETFEECVFEFKEMVKENIKQIEKWKIEQDSRYASLVKENSDLLEM